MSLGQNVALVLVNTFMKFDENGNCCHVFEFSKSIKGDNLIKLQ